MDIRDMKLSDTVAMMNSSDYRERFRAEYFQLLIRHHKLLDMCQKWDSGKLDFKPTCSRGTYAEQLMLMNKLLLLMEDRAKIEHINIDVTNIELPSALSPSADSEKLVSAGTSLECIRAELCRCDEFWSEAKKVCNNTFIEGLADYSQNAIQGIISIVQEDKVWQQQFSELAELEKE